MGKEFKLGIFMPSVSHSPNISAYKPDPDDWTFSKNVEIAKIAEKAGFDFLFPISRWRTIGGQINFHGNSLETMTWAAGLLASTKRMEIFSTVHVPVFNPVVVAKMGATLDHMSGGRWGINIVSGWNKAEFDMMGLEMLPHESRYERSTDFINILKGLWLEEPGRFNFRSSFYTVKGGYCMPQPVRKPHPPIVNAGTSNAAREMVGKYCDWAFICPISFEDAQEIAEDIKGRAHKAGRKVRVVSMAQPIWHTDSSVAYAERDRVLEQMDHEALASWAEGAGLESESFDQQTLETFCFGSGAMPLLGTPEDVATQIAEFKKAGVDGLLMSYMDFLRDTERFGKDILPILDRMGVL
tara:strand:- start:4391 stop:5452 length:1062 start_codon:yes stop_codon:yes gene_type:complete